MEVLKNKREVEAVRRVKAVLDEYGPFVSLAEAARQTGVALPTLADAVRKGRIPALQVQKRRWLVRVSAVRHYFGNRPDDEMELQRRLVEAGLLPAVKPQRERTFTMQNPISYMGEKSVSEWLIDERR